MLRLDKCCCQNESSYPTNKSPGPRDPYGCNIKLLFPTPGVIHPLLPISCCPHERLHKFQAFRLGWERLFCARNTVSWTYYNCMKLIMKEKAGRYRAPICVPVCCSHVFPVVGDVCPPPADSGQKVTGMSQLSQSYYECTYPLALTELTSKNDLQIALNAFWCNSSARKGLNFACTQATYCTGNTSTALYTSRSLNCLIECDQHKRAPRSAHTRLRHSLTANLHIENISFIKSKY